MHCIAKNEAMEKSLTKTGIPAGIIHQSRNKL